MTLLLHDYSDVVDLSDMFDESACWVDTVIPPDKENHIIAVADKVVDPSDKLPTTVLGSCPTLLTPQDKFPVSAVLQVVEKKRKRPPEKPKYGGDQKKKVKQVWKSHRSTWSKVQTFPWLVQTDHLRCRGSTGPMDMVD